MKKGFTLIELLAVIVILAIIALIATPIILGIINDAREEADKRSVELYAKGLELAIARKNLTEDFNPEFCEVQSDGNAMCTVGSKQIPITVDVEGKENISGKATFVNGRIEKNDLYIGENTKEEILSLCEADTGVNLSDLKLGDKFTCTLGGEDHTFYVLEDGDNTTLTDGRLAQAGQVSLILDRNLGEPVDWISKDDFEAKNPSRYAELQEGPYCMYQESRCAENTYGPVTANAYLASQTSNWEVAPTLPTLKQVYYATNNSSEHDYYEWLIDNLENRTHSVPNVLGYWTSTVGDNSYTAWMMNASGIGGQEDVTVVLGGIKIYGVRPVITIPKTALK